MVTEPEGFREFVESRSPALVRTAYLLTGDRQRAEDLVQTALARTWPHWDRIRDGYPEAFVRTTMVNLQSSWWRRRWRGEIPRETLPEPGVAGGQDAVDDRLTLAWALAQLPLGQRQIVVLRYLDELSVDEVARTAGCSPGTVKSQCSRGLAKLRLLLAEGEGT